MPPTPGSEASITYVDNNDLQPDLNGMKEIEDKAKVDKFVAKIVWRNAILFTLLHIGAVVGLYQLVFMAKWWTVAFILFLYFLSVLGVTMGAHRLWSHRSFKANWPVRAFLMLSETMAFQNDIIEWARDHRCHHKWTDTDADPHNIGRGVFFAHMGWLMVRKHPEVARRGATLDLKDLFADPILRFQRRFYLPLLLLMCFVMPTFVAVQCCGEDVKVAFCTAALFRYCFTLHVIWLINSAAHIFGYRPYDPFISPAENHMTTVLALGEGGHNYHHTFPQDYRSSEYNSLFNWTKHVIDLFASIGWIYDRKVIAKQVVDRQCLKFAATKQSEKGDRLRCG